MSANGGSSSGRIRVLLLGGGAREHAIGVALTRSGRVDLFTLAHNPNPGLEAISEAYLVAAESDCHAVVAAARERETDFVVVGLEDPLAAGLPDALAAAGIPTVGPRRAAAAVETSKLFLRELMDRHGLRGRVDYRHFTDADRFEEFLAATSRDYALKPIGLTAGKGVRVMGVQLASKQDAIEYGRAVIRDDIGGSGGLVVEERLRGVEYTLQAFVDGECLVPMPLVKDYKLAYEGERGPNTGSMGSYSEATGTLSFVDDSTYDESIGILRSITKALSAEQIHYCGVLYGQFMLTADGPKIVECNARFGDPEAINVLSLLQTDFVDICLALIEGRLDAITPTFAKRATVCKYLTPPGYPDNPDENARLEIDTEEIKALGVQVFFAKVAERHGAFYTTTSRTAALLATGDTVDEAEHLVEDAIARHVRGRFHRRRDIGTRTLRDLTERPVREELATSMA